MSNDQCRLCHRDLSPDVLVRCREPECPLTASRSRASIVVLSGLLGIALIVGAVVVAVSWLSRDKPQPASVTSPPMESAASSADSTPARARASADVDFASASGRDTPGNAKNSQPGQGAAGSSGAVEPASVEAADPRAATLVQSFSCEGRLSSARAWICTHMSLAMRDYNLSLQYKSVLVRTRNSAALRRAHAAWLARLDELGDDPPTLDKAFNAWRDELSRK